MYSFEQLKSAKETFKDAISASVVAKTNYRFLEAKLRGELIRNALISEFYIRVKPDNADVEYREDLKNDVSKLDFLEPEIMPDDLKHLNEGVRHIVQQLQKQHSGDVTWKNASPLIIPQLYPRKDKVDERKDKTITHYSLVPTKEGEDKERKIEISSAFFNESHSFLYLGNGYFGREKPICHKTKSDNITAAVKHLSGNIARCVKEVGIVLDAPSPSGAQ